MLGRVKKQVIEVPRLFSINGNKHVADEVIDSIMENYKDCFFSEKIKFQVNLIIDEIFGNISSYAFKDRDGRVNIVTWIEENPARFIIKFVDNGVAFNPLEAEEPDINATLDERKVGGLGIHLIKNLVDSMEYKNIHGCNVLVVTKNIY